MSVRSWQYFHVFVSFTASIDRGRTFSGGTFHVDVGSRTINRYSRYVPSSHTSLAAGAGGGGRAAEEHPSHVRKTRSSSERCVPAAACSFEERELPN